MLHLPITDKARAFLIAAGVFRPATSCPLAPERVTCDHDEQRRLMREYESTHGETMRGEPVPIGL